MCMHVLVRMKMTANFLCDWIREQKTLLRKILDQFSSVDYNGGWLCSNIFGEMRMPSGSRLAVSSAVRRRLSHAFIALMRRSYYSRVWILQEPYLGRTTWLCCGAQAIPLRDLLAASIIFTFWRVPDKFLSTPTRSTLLGKVTNTCHRTIAFLGRFNYYGGSDKDWEQHKLLLLGWNVKRAVTPLSTELYERFRLSR
ncbi:hypothetical protein BU23DRAFT_628021 [Bimuria novae-zelandiae CBS 107.79]|uniref:Heterokaryon incompatibility domain-containing protein n=1 Tax=Bimuria novae-zelandiae CBS 107.79 TaxID=1447943 RepID=A0A6A5VLA7_9PLEO|nr:hypothetical protein BU23DRAFT_628021 [Bimuria novae-zelandiae CBS 107.79]